MSNRYYVRREECWGGTYLWFVADREKHLPWQASVIGVGYKTESQAKKYCERANRDFDQLMNHAAGQLRKTE